MNSADLQKLMRSFPSPHAGGATAIMLRADEVRIVAIALHALANLSVQVRQTDGTSIQQLVKGTTTYGEAGITVTLPPITVTPAGSGGGGGSSGNWNYRGTWS